MARKLTPQELARQRMLRALAIARILFEQEGYHTEYLEQIEAIIRDR